MVKCRQAPTVHCAATVLPVSLCRHSAAIKQAAGMVNNIYATLVNSTSRLDYHCVLGAHSAVTMEAHCSTALTSG